MANVPGYVANTFTAGEQPTTTVWNELWSNDAAFNSFLTGPNITYGLLASGIFSGQAQSFTNTGSAGGTFQYVNIGGIKLLSGISAVLGAPAASFATGTPYSVNFPSGFFSSIWSGEPWVQSVSSTASQFVVMTGTPSTSSASFYTLQAGTDASATLQVGLTVIGT